MSFLNNFYFNYPAISTLESFFLFLASSLFLFMIPNKSQATKYLFYCTFFGMFVGLGYALTQGYYAENPIARMMTLFTIPIHFLFYSQFILHFPRLEKPGLAKFLLILQSSITVFLIFRLSYLSYNQNMIFDFDGESFEYDIFDFLKLYGLITFLFIILAIILGIWRIFSLNGKDRYYQILIFLGVFVAILIPGIANVLGKLGLVTRGAYLVSVSLSTNTGVFILIIAFINRTPDRTTFMAKILAVCFLIFIIVYNFLAYFALRERENSYLTLKSRDMELAPLKPEAVKDLKYVLSYHLDREDFQVIDTNNSTSLNEFHKVDLMKVLYLKKLEAMPANKDLLKEYWDLFFNSNHTHEKSFLLPFHRHLFRRISDDLTKNNLSSVLQEERKKLFKIHNDLKLIPVKNIKEQIPKFLEKQGPDFTDFKDAILHYSQMNTDKDDFLFKEGVLQFVKPYPVDTQKLFREDSKTKTHYIAFIRYDEKNLTLSETGFTYQFYREYIDREARIFVYLLFFALCLIFLGTPVFLSRALVMPLERLLFGLRKVERGNLDVVVTVGVHDEIGFLTNSFNTMVASIKESKHKLDEYSNHLEEKVEERTRDLLLSKNEIEKLKIQQDGDYFLTKLIIEPLASNVQGDSSVQIQSFTKQKKQFEFKKRIHEIGGDICISDTLNLRGKVFTAFLNGDAMGKSIQGAGGALALGVVFKSILSRNKILSGNENIFPERWLKQSYQELQSIFETFDGSMMASVVIGLVDNECGFLYYINAEHPFCVLYRDKKASFLEDELNIHKIGMLIPDRFGDFRVKTFQLQKGDIVLMGSGGKDDLKIGIDETGNRIINEDENLFLKTAEEANADLAQIYTITERIGELTDDFSLLRIQYNGNSPQEEDSENSLLKSALYYYNQEEFQKVIDILEMIGNSNTGKTYLRLKANILYKQGDFRNAAETYSILLNLYPGESMFLLAAAKSYKLSSQLELAADYSERLKLREPTNLNNLILLIEIYIALQMYGRAKKILENAMHLGYSNEKLTELKIKIEKYFP